ncbi:MAG: HU family DNA-binding protein [Bacteroidota bacterium]
MITPCSIPTTLSFQQNPEFINTTSQLKSFNIFLHQSFINIKPIKIKKTMNKADLIDAMSSEAKITKADAQRALDAFLMVTSKSLKKGEKVTLVGFGTFSVAKRAARTGRNPQTGKEIKIAAKKVAKFKAGSELAQKVR